MAIYMTAQWQCRRGAESKVDDALRRYVAAVQENEPDTRVYSAFQDTGDESRFMTFFVFENQAAQEFHRSTDWVKAFTDVIYPENVEPVRFSEYRLVASTLSEE